MADKDIADVTSAAPDTGDDVLGVQRPSGDSKLFNLGDILGLGGGGVTYPLLAPDGSNSAPSYSFASETGTGMYHAAGELYLVVQGVQRLILTEQRAIMGRLEASVGTESVPSHTFAADTDTGMYNGGNPNRLSFTLGGVESTRMEAGGASTTRFWLYDETNGGLKQVQVGAADSGGSGFRMLRVVN